MAVVPSKNWTVPVGVGVDWLGGLICAVNVTELPEAIGPDAPLVTTVELLVSEPTLLSYVGTPELSPL
jgi:hypothetical protein